MNKFKISRKDLAYTIDVWLGEQPEKTRSYFDINFAKSLKNDILATKSESDKECKVVWHKDKNGQLDYVKQTKHQEELEVEESIEYALLKSLKDKNYEQLRRIEKLEKSIKAHNALVKEVRGSKSNGGCASSGTSFSNGGDYPIPNGR